MQKTVPNLSISNKTSKTLTPPPPLPSAPPALHPPPHHTSLTLLISNSFFRSRATTKSADASLGARGHSPTGFPWAGHLGLRMYQQLVDHLSPAVSTLLFTNTRNSGTPLQHYFGGASPELLRSTLEPPGSLWSSLKHSGPFWSSIQYSRALQSNITPL